MSSIIESLTASLRADPGSWRCRLALIEVLLWEKREEEAHGLLAEVTELPDDLESQVIAGRAYGLIDPATGLQIFDSILEEHPDCAKAHLEKARVCKTLGDFDQAQKSYSASLTLDPSLHDTTLEAIFGGVPPEEAPFTAGDGLSDALQQAREVVIDLLSEREHKTKIQSLIIGSSLTLILCLLMIVVKTSGPPPTPPQIVASAPPDDTVPVENERLKRMKKNMEPSTPPQGAMSMNMMAVSAPSELTIAPVDPTSFGIGDATVSMGFGPSMSLGNAGGSSAMFFGSRSSGKRFLFVLDASKSMKDNQVELRNNELSRALRNLRGAEYQILLFAGGAFFADEGWGVDPDDDGGRYGPEKYTSPNGKYEFLAKSLFSFHLVGEERKFPTPKWKKADSISVRKSIETVESSKLFSGTDWDNALRIGLLMKPPPDVIFFMSDGLDDELNISSIVRNSEKNGRPRINSIAMQTKEGAKNFAAIAEETGGTFTIVDKEGKPIDGFDFLKDPDKYKERLR